MIEPDANEKSLFRGDKYFKRLRSEVHDKLEWCQKYMTNPNDWDEFLCRVGDCVEAYVRIHDLNIDGVSGRKRDRKDRDAVRLIRKNLDKLRPSTIRMLWTVFDHGLDSEEKCGEKRIEGSKQLIADCDAWLKAVSVKKQVELQLPRGLLGALVPVVSQYTTIKLSYNENSSLVTLCSEVTQLVFGDAYKTSTIRNWVRALCSEQK
jgi:hypothetical protein